jgi:uncharacterized membrane protein
MATKTFSFAVMHFTVAFSVAYLMTGSVMVGGAIALVEPAVNTVAFYVHERFWQQLRPGAVDDRPTAGPSTSCGPMQGNTVWMARRTLTQE